MKKFNLFKLCLVLLLLCAVFFIRTNTEAKPMAQIMCELLAVAGNENADAFLTQNYFSIQSAGIVLSVIPILAIYPFVIRNNKF